MAKECLGSGLPELGLPQADNVKLKYFDTLIELVCECFR